MTPHPPRVTVIAQCYNHERFVLECLDAIHHQTFQAFHLVVVDDCSRDRSPTLIREWIAANRPEATFLALPQNVGVTKALNQAMRLVHTEFVTAVATDDLWEPTLLERLVTRFDEVTDAYAAVFSDASCIDERGAPLAVDFFEAHGASRPDRDDLFADLSEQNFIPACSIMLRMAAVREVGEYDETLAYEDWDMWLRLSERFLMAFIPERLARYRIVQGSLVRTLFVEGVPSPDAHATHCAMAIKQLRSRKHGARARLLWRARLLHHAKELYVIGDARAARFLRRAAAEQHDTRGRTMLLAVAASVGIPAAPVLATARRLKGRRPTPSASAEP